MLFHKYLSEHVSLGNTSSTKAGADAPKHRTGGKQAGGGSGLEEQTGS